MAAVTASDVRLRHPRHPTSCIFGERQKPSTIAKRAHIGIDNNAPQAGDRIADALERRYRYFGLILLNPLFDELQQMRQLTTEVIPELP
jgi:hypothetical protein